MTHPAESLRAAMVACGIHWLGEIRIDGHWHRFKPSGSKNRTGFYKLHPGEVVRGIFGDWKLGIKERFTDGKFSSLSDHDRQRLRQQWQKEEKAKAVREEALQKRAQSIAAHLMNEARLVETHPYLTAKGIEPPAGIKLHPEGALMIPLSVAGTLTSLQFIDADGEKRFLSKGRIKGAAFTIHGSDNGPLIVCEGVATGASINKATRFTVVCAMNCGNFEPVVKSLRTRFPDREIVIAGDDDRSSLHNCGRLAAEAAAGRYRAVAVFPVGGSGTDFNDLHTSRGLDEVRRQIRAALGTSTPDVETLKSDRPLIRLPGDDRLLSDFAAELADGVRHADIYARNGLVYALNHAGDNLTQVDAVAFITWTENFFSGYTLRKGVSGKVLRSMSQSTAEAVLASDQFISKLRQVERFNPIRMPVDGAGGLVLLPAGYDVTTRTLTHRNGPRIDPEMPFADAKAELDDLLSEFGFADGGRSKAVAIAAMLTVFGRQLLPANSLRPCFIYVANAEGAGKTLLVKLATVPVLGSAPASACPHDEDEMRKLLLSAILEMRPVILLDNFKGRLSSESLEGFITAQQWTGRILGGNKTFTGANECTVFVTGNGATVSPDMRRRSLFAELFMAEERAEDRRFHRMLETGPLIERRETILSALFTIVRHWRDSGRPKASRSHSSFPEWTDAIGGAIEAAGYSCPVETPKIEGAADTDGEDMRELVAGILDGSTMRSVAFDELVAICKDRGAFESIISTIDSKEAQKGRATLGKLLKRYDGRLVGGCRFELTGKGHGRRFKVERLP